MPFAANRRASRSFDYGIREYSGLEFVQRGEERRMLGRSGFVLATLGLLLGCHAALAGDRVPLQKGDAGPDISFVDITGKASATSNYASWVQVYTFADRESSEELKMWMGPAQIEATRAHPELSVVYLTFADLASIPRFLRGMVRPVLNKTFENSNEELADAYRKIGVEPDPDKVEFVFAPDWDGAHLETFGLEDAKAYHCWIVADGRVVEVLDASTPDLAARYAAAFAAIAATSSFAPAQPADLSATQPD
jgi:hypothetical protein